MSPTPESVLLGYAVHVPDATHVHRERGYWHAYTSPYGPIDDADRGHYCEDAEADAASWREDGYTARIGRVVWIPESEEE